MSTRGTVCCGEAEFGSWPSDALAGSSSPATAATPANRTIIFNDAVALRDISLRELTIWQNLFDRVLLRPHASAIERQRTCSNDADYHETD